MVDTYVSGAYGEICVGSSPISDIFLTVIYESLLINKTNCSKKFIKRKCINEALAKKI